MAKIALLFQSQSAANTLVAGVPAGARAAHGLLTSGIAQLSDEVIIVTPEGLAPSPVLERELARLAPHHGCTVHSIADISAMPDIQAFAGGDLVGPDHTARPVPIEKFRLDSPREELLRLSNSGRDILKNTVKTTDGAVSRLLNRPISQTISGLLLRSDWPRPIHATIATSLIGAIMALCLLFGGEAGLIWGAILFQAASIMDGVDGEIARATYRTSKLGATLDTAGDAATNLAFIAGVSINLWARGDLISAQVGFIGLAVLALGLTVLGFRSLLAGEPLNFDALKHDNRTRSNPVLKRLTNIASRDVYALIFAVLVLFGLADIAMMAFTIAVSLWLTTLAVMLACRNTHYGD